MDYSVKFAKDGNIKVGAMWTISKLAGSGTINGCKGTCGKYCTGCYNEEDPKHSPCYAIKSMARYGWEISSIAKGHIRNTEGFRNNIDKAFKDMELQIKRAKNKPDFIRIDAAGEIISTKEIQKWNELSEKFPNIIFYVYTKAYDYLEEFFDSMTEPKINDNFFILISIWHEIGIDIYNKYKHIKNVKCFVYDDEKFDYKNSDLGEIKVYCPAYRKNQKGRVKLYHEVTCDKCGICNGNSQIKIIGCLSH